MTHKTMYNTAAPFNGLINELFNGWEKLDTVTPATNITEHATNYALNMLVAGIAKEDVKIAIEHNKLTISFDATTTEADATIKTHRKEFSVNSFKRSFKLINKINVDAIVAKQENGVLTITLPKKEEEQPSVKNIIVD